jgi:hypothetical protein
MTTLSQRIKVLEQFNFFLSDYLNEWKQNNKYPDHSRFSEINIAVKKTIANNAWFTEETIKDSFEGIITFLDANKLKSWISGYSFPDETKKNIGVIMAGNIPLVGFHDFLCVLMSGHRFIGKLSSDDPFLLPVFANVLKEFDSNLAEMMHFSSGKLSGFDAIIATGSDNSARYFEFYFGKYPNIIRRNRNSLAILEGDESLEDFQKLAIDIFSYFGLGCRSVSSVLIPSGFEPWKLFEGFTAFKKLLNHTKYFNNYEFNKAIYLVNNDLHYDNGFLLMKEDKRISSPVAVLNFQFYDNIEALKVFMELHNPEIQCIVSKNGKWPFSVNFGEAQKPLIKDFADNIDTLDFLLNLK